MNFLSRLFGDRRDRSALRPLYDALVVRARNPFWYRDGGVPDTLTGRFEMVAAFLSLVLLRLEREGDAARADSVRLTEIFIDDMDGVLRELGIGDVVVGKHVGKLMGALGGRLGALRDGLAGEGDLEAAVRRNVFRGAPPSEAQVALVAARLREAHAAFSGAELEQLRAGTLAGA